MDNLQFRRLQYRIVNRAHRYSQVSAHFFKSNALVLRVCKAIANAENKAIVFLGAIGLFMLLSGILSSSVVFIILGILALMTSLLQ